jgi:hypothetical protein
MPWYVACAPTPSNGRLGVFIASPTIIAVGQKQQLSVDMRTGQVLFIVRCHGHVSRPLGSAAVNRWIRLLPYCLVLQPESARCGPLYADCSVSH